MFDAISFPGGGNRCYWQGGFWEAAAPALNLAPHRVVGVSGGAFAAAYSLLGVGATVRALVIAGCERGLPNFDWRALRGGDPFPVAPMYRALLDATLDEAAFTAIRAMTDLQVMIARPPRRWPASLAAAVGLASYQIEKKFLQPVHPTWGRKLGFVGEYVAVRALPDARAWADLTFASASVPPIIGVQTIGGRPAVDGGMAGNVPVEPLEEIEAQGGRTLVLLTRRYKTLPVVANRVYTQPSQPIPVGQFDIANAAGVRDAYELGLRDGAAFAQSMR